ncbi:MAG: helix-turn-helix transcriptional regulator [Woeseiaceae bacterium]|nr:helix-turn-helix transcriptional regulator [Woeseiaceae bacterium]
MIKTRLDIVMTERRVTGRELANAVGITEQNLSLLRNGKVKGVRFGTLSKICEVLDCQPGDLLIYEPDA